MSEKSAGDKRNKQQPNLSTAEHKKIAQQIIDRRKWQKALEIADEYLDFKDSGKKPH